MRIYLFTDYNKFFYSSVRRGNQTMNIELLNKYFSQSGIDLVIKSFADINFRDQNYNREYVLYTSSEDRNLYYKDYIEDILLGLVCSGARLIPDFKYFRAHHNKVFMEVLRAIHPDDSIKNIYTKTFGALEELKKKVDELPEALVLKVADGALSRGVVLVDTKEQLLESAKTISMSPVTHNSGFMIFIDYYITKYIDFVRKAKRIIEDDLKLKKKRNIYSKPVSRNRKKFIVQTYVPKLSHDYKILVYGEKYYVLKRNIPKNDFKASGSGLFEWPAVPPRGLLDFAKQVYMGFNVPFISIDVGFDGKDFYLFEFQCLYFGNYTLEYSTFYFKYENSAWVKYYEDSILEKEFVNSVVRFIHNEHKVDLEGEAIRL